MNGGWRRWLSGILSREETVPIASCVHFCGFRYGRGEYQPYESYVTALARGEDRAAARGRFVRFLQHYRPRHFAEALGATSVREHPLWSYPWIARPPPPAWRETFAECPDILTHFCAQGVSGPRIREEWSWLEGALASIREHGYQPARFGSPLSVRRLESADGARMHLVLDGNHRLSALSALGHTVAPVRLLARSVVRETELRRWPQVRSGAWSPEDAQAVFRAYFNGNHRPETTTQPAAWREEPA
jgi:hypothetical protein